MADEGIKAGDAYIQATLRMDKDAFKKLAAENSGSATKAGDDLGDRIGKAISKRIAQSVRDGLGQGGGFAAPQGAKAGDEYGGKFASVVKARIDAALRSLPKAEVGVATTEADRKLESLRGELSALSGKRIGVDLSAEDALSQVRRIRTDLDELGAKSPNIQVKTDAAAASAQLAAIQTQVNRLSGQNANVNVSTNANQESQKVFTLANALILLGPAAVPSAAAAAAAILGIGVAATSVFAAIGVGKLAFQGVGGALTAIDNAQQGAAKSGATLAQQQGQLASGADSVKSAEASLANTRASAADSIRQANERVAQSQRTLTDAERAAQRAQVDLTTAQKDAARQIEDLNTAVEDGALSQRRALEDQQKAQLALNTVNQAGSGATAAQRADAQLTFDEAVQHVKDLNIQQSRAVVDRDAANKAGVAGSKQVISAQDQVLQANQKVADAQRGIADAEAARVAASRQAAFSIAQAQQSVASAQRSLGQAFVATGVTGGAAIDALHLALSKLSPEGQRFAYFLYSLKPRLDELKQSAQAGLFPGLQAGITTVLPYFGQLDRFVGSVATELGHLGGEAAHTFTDPFWRQFFSFIADQAVPNLELMYRSVVNVAEGGARIIQAFGPVEREVGQVILGLTQKFLGFSQAAGQNQGLQQFVRYAQTEVPHVVSTIESLVTTASHVIQAYAPIGSVVVSDLKLLSQIINAIPVGVVTALASAFAAYRLATSLSSLATQGLGSNLVAAIAKMVAFRTVTSATATTTTGLQRAVAGTAGALGGGLFTAALSGAIILFGIMAQKQQEAKVKSDELTTSIKDFTAALADTSTSQGDATANSLLKQSSALRELVQVTKDHGISTETLTHALNGEANARDSVVAAIDDQIGATSLRLAYETGKEREADKAKLAGLEALRGAFIQQSQDSARATADATTLAKAQKSSGDAARDMANGYVATSDAAKALQPTIDGLVNTYDILTGRIGSAADRARVFKDMLDATTQSVISGVEATEKQVASALELSGALKTNGSNFDLNKAKTDDQKRATLANRDALEAALTAVRDKTVADIAGGTAITDATRKNDEQVASILNSLPKDAQKSKAVQEIADDYGRIPKNVSTDVKITGADTVLAQLRETQIAQYALDNNISIAAARSHEAGQLNTFNSQVPAAGRVGNAEGGLISGPGTTTSDSIVARGPIPSIEYRLSDKEFITKAKAVDYYGVAAMRAINSMAIPREMLAFSNGGLVHWPINVDASKAAIPGVHPKPKRGAASVTDLASVAILELLAGKTYRGTSPQVVSWIGQAIKYVNEPPSWIYPYEVLISRESGGNPRSINLTDSNAKRGDPSRGLTQTIGSTFEHWRDKRLVDDIYDPVANIVASMNYVKNRYGTIFNVQQADPNKPPKGYDGGGWLPQGLTMANNATARPEAILTGGQWDAMLTLASRAQAAPDVRVYIGNEEITRHVQVVVDQKMDAVAASVGSGVRDY